MTSTNIMSGVASDVTGELAEIRSPSPVPIVPGPPLMTHWTAPPVAPSWIERPRTLEPAAMRYERWSPSPLPVPRADVPLGRRLPAPRPFSSSLSAAPAAPVNHGQAANPSAVPANPPPPPASPAALPNLRPSPPQQRQTPPPFVPARVAGPRPADLAGLSTIAARALSASQAPSAPRQQPAGLNNQPPIPPRPSPSPSPVPPPQKRRRETDDPNPVPPRRPSSPPLTNGWQAINHRDRDRDRDPPTGIFPPPRSLTPAGSVPRLLLPPPPPPSNSLTNNNNLATIDEATEGEEDDDETEDADANPQRQRRGADADGGGGGQEDGTIDADADADADTGNSRKVNGNKSKRARKSSGGSTGSGSSGVSGTSGASGASSVTLPRRSSRKRSEVKRLGGGG